MPMAYILIEKNKYYKAIGNIYYDLLTDFIFIKWLLIYNEIGGQLWARSPSIFKLYVS